MTAMLALPLSMAAWLTEEAAQWEQPVEEYLKLVIAQAMPKPRTEAALDTKTNVRLSVLNQMKALGMPGAYLSSAVGSFISD